MPRLIADFARECEGRIIQQVGYVIRDGEAWPVLLLDNGAIISARRDDEGNGPGVFTAGGAILCQTRPVAEGTTGA